MWSLETTAFIIMGEELLYLKTWPDSLRKSRLETRTLSVQVLTSLNTAKQHLFFRSELDLTLVSEIKTTYVPLKLMDPVQALTNSQAQLKLQVKGLPCLLMAPSEWQPPLETPHELSAICLKTLQLPTCTDQSSSLSHLMLIVSLNRPMTETFSKVLLYLDLNPIIKLVWPI